MSRGIVHDESKLNEPEFSQFAKSIPKLKKTTFGEEDYEKAKESLGDALYHHYQYNDHHPEHFENGVHDMDIIQLTEMLCDMMAAVTRHENGDIHNSIDVMEEEGKITPDIASIFRNTINTLEYGS